MNLNPRVKKAKAEKGYKIHLVFSNGENKVFDASPLINQGIFRELINQTVFKSIRVSHGSVQWPGGQDICPDPLYEDSIPVRHVGVAESRSKYSIKPKKRQSRGSR